MNLTYRGSGKVFYNKIEYDCDLYLNEEEGGILVSVIIKESMASFLSLPLIIGVLPGELSTGYRFTLVDCNREKMSNNISEGRSIFTYYVQFMYQGVGGENGKEQLFYKVNFSLPNIMQWGELSGYKIENEQLLQNDREKQVMYQNNEVVLNYWVSSSMLPVAQTELLIDKIILKQIGIIEISFVNSTSIEKYIRLFNKVKWLLELSMLRKIHPKNITGWSSDIFYMYNERKIERPIEILHCDSRNKIDEMDKDEFFKSRRWINLSELIENDSFSCYFSKYEILEPVIELYIEIIHSKDSSSRHVFLNLVQALETYHSRLITNNLIEFKKRIDNVILKNRPEEWKIKDKKFLIANSRKFITLESRLADLLLAEFQYRFDTGNIKYYDYPNVIALSRNYYIHYDETIKVKGKVLFEDELSIYNRSLFCILEYYLMKEIGFSDENKIRQKLNERWGSISDTIAIIEASNIKVNDIENCKN